MKTFRLKIPDSCYTIGQRLQVKMLLLKHKWFVLGENGYEDLLTFHRNGALLIYLKEKETKGFWTYNTKTNSLALREIKNKPSRALRPFFWDSYLLVFKLHTLDEYLFLVNADKAYKLLVNPLDCFEKYAEGAMERLKNDRRRKLDDEDQIILMDLKPLNAKDIKQVEMSLQESIAAEDPKNIVTIYPGPIALEAKPVEQPVKKAKPEVTSPQAEIPVPDIEERIQQALRDQQKELDKKWKAKLEAETEKLNAALWVEKNEVERRINKALKSQARVLELQHQKNLREQKQNLKTKEQEVRAKWIGKVKEQIAQLRKNKDRDIEMACLAEQAEHKFDVQKELRKQKKFYDSRINSLVKKATELEGELIQIKMKHKLLKETSKEQTNQQIDELKQHMSDSSIQCQDLEKQVQYLSDERKELEAQVKYLIEVCHNQEKHMHDLEDELMVEKQKYHADMKTEKEKYSLLIKEIGDGNAYIDLYKRHTLDGFRNLWDCHVMLADYCINPKLKKARKKDPSHISYCYKRNILISVILFLTMFLCFSNTIYHALDNLCYQIRLPFLNHDSWDIALLFVSALLILGIAFLMFFTIIDIENRKDMKKKMYKVYVEEFILRILGEKKPEKEGV